MTFAEKWWTYQRERFPLLAHGVLIAAFSFCAVSLSRMLRGVEGFPPALSLLVAFGTCFTFFLQLRIADEFKDYEEDLKFRPYRPVQRGLVTLRELGVLFVICGLVQALLALALQPKLLGLLAITWVYLALMSKEFFVESWIRARPILYMLSHMLIMPLVDLYATSTDWLASHSSPPRGLNWFLAASYCNGLVIEIGRKIRSPMDEEVGVQTYSFMWGRGAALVTWVAVMLATLCFAIVVAHQMRLQVPIGAVLAFTFIDSSFLAFRFHKHSEPRRGKWIETVSGIWTIAVYLTLGLLPHFLSRGQP